MDIVWRLGGLADGAPRLSVDGMIGWRVDGLTDRSVDVSVRKLTCRLVSWTVGLLVASVLGCCST